MTLFIDEDERGDLFLVYEGNIGEGWAPRVGALDDTALWDEYVAACNAMHAVRSRVIAAARAVTDKDPEACGARRWYRRWPMSRMHPNGQDRRRALRAPSVIQYAEYSATSDLFNIGGAWFPPSRFFDVVEAFGFDYEQTHGALAAGRAIYSAARLHLDGERARAR